jgi:hypothetical protein
MRTATAVMTVIALSSFARAADAYGAAAVNENQTYTLEQMLTYAIQEEYLSYARNMAAAAKFDEVRPFSKIAEDAKMHIILLKALAEKFGVPVPLDESSGFVSAPETLEDALKAGSEAEKLTRRMYEIFLGHDLPGDAKLVFTAMRNASGNHLKAFEKSMLRAGRSAPRVPPSRPQETRVQPET